jgi:hypothetical protein
MRRPTTKCTASALALLVALGAGSAQSQQPVPLTMLTDTAARCMDGTLSGYYFQAATNASVSTTWVLYLEGGGECTTQTVSSPRTNACSGAALWSASANPAPATHPDAAAAPCRPARRN